MGRVLIATWAGGGNVNPALGLAAELQALGHEVRGLGSASLADRFAAAGVPFIARDPAREWDLDAAADDVLAETSYEPTDAAVVDYMLPGLLCGAEAAGVPTAVLVHTLYASNVFDGELMTMTMAASVDGTNGVRTRLGLDPVGRLRELLDRADRVVVTAPAELDGEVPAGVTHTGPVLEGPGPDEGWTPPLDGDDPLVVVALGTTPMDELPVLQAVLSGLAGRPVRVLATVGDHVDADGLVVPGNATVTGYVRHAAVLPHAALVVCHAGLGTVLAGLAHGLPVLCLPLGRDQPGNAAAVERVGAGRSLDPATPAGDIGATAEELLADGPHRSAAQRMAASIEATRGRTAAVVGALLR